MSTAEGPTKSADLVAGRTLTNENLTRERWETFEEQVDGKDRVQLRGRRGSNLEDDGANLDFITVDNGSSVDDGDPFEDGNGQRRRLVDIRGRKIHQKSHRRELELPPGAAGGKHTAGVRRSLIS